MDSTYWRKRANEARVFAGWMRDKEARQIMLNIAREYDRLAELDQSHQTEVSAAPESTLSDSGITAGLPQV